MLVPEELLLLDAKQAVYKMAQELLDVNFPGVQAQWYSLSDPMVIEDNTTEVLFTLNKALTPVEHWGAVNSFPLLYKRLYLSDFIEHGTEVIGLAPITSYKLAASVLARWQVPLGEYEVESSSVTTDGVVTIDVSDKSYRWIGSATMTYVDSRLPIQELVIRNRVIPNLSMDLSSDNIRRHIVDQLNSFNASRLPRELNNGDVRVCVPMVEGLISDAVNTRITIKAVSGDFDGEDYVLYKRKSFQETWRKPIEIEYTGQTHVSDLLQELSAKVKCTIVERDIHLAPIVGVPDRHTPVDVDIYFREDSLAYVGEIKVRLILIPVYG